MSSQPPLPICHAPFPDGFRKQIVALTSSGKVVAVHNGDGRLLWSLDLGRAAGLRKLVLWRVPHDVQHDIQVGGGMRQRTPYAVAVGGSMHVACCAARRRVYAGVLRILHCGSLGSMLLPATDCPASSGPNLAAPCLQVAAVATGPGSSGRVIVINAHTGAVEQTLAAEGEAAQLLHLPQPLHDGSADQHAYVLVPAGSAGAANVLPDTAEARAAFQTARPALGFWRVDKAAGSIQGLGFAGETLGWASQRTCSARLPHYALCPLVDCSSRQVAACPPCCLPLV